MSSKPSENDEDGGNLVPSSVEEDAEESGLTELLEALPEEQRGRFIQVLERTISHQGWLPPPEMLSAYDQVLPGLGERIVQLPEREQRHRHQFMDNEADRAFRLQTRGQMFALAAMGMLLAFSGFLAWLGSPEAAAGVAGATIIGVVGIFVTGKVVDARAKANEES